MTDSLDTTREIQPQFPPSYTRDNNCSLEWSNMGLIAFASGPCCLISYFRGDALVSCGSVELSPYNISCFKFHPTLRLLGVGDVHGRVFLWDFDGSKFVASAKPLRPNEICVAMNWHDDTLIVLTSSRALVGVGHHLGASTYTLKNFAILWTLQLPADYARFSSDPHTSRVLMLASSQNYFAFYQTADRDRPTPFGEAVELSRTVAIVYAQWSLHMPGFIFLLLDRNLWFFHLQSRSLIPLTSDTSISSPFAFLVQFPGDHTRLVCGHRNGTLSLQKADDDLVYRHGDDIQHSNLIAATISPTNDNFLAVFHQHQGLGLFDIGQMRLVMMDLSFPADVTAFDSDAIRYALGTDGGVLILGNVFDRHEIKRFAVSDQAISFVSFDAPRGRVYWQTERDLGVLDIASRCNNVFSAMGAGSLRCFGSHRGALIVQREQRALGVFISGKEWPLLLESPIADVSVNEEESNQVKGEFCVLLTNGDVIFYCYHNRTDIEEIGRGMKPGGLEGEPRAIATREQEYTIGFANGLLLFVNVLAKTVKRIGTEAQNIRHLCYAKGDGDSLFGLCRDDRLFECRNARLRMCEFEVKSFKVVSETLMMVKASDGMVKFVTIENFRPLSYFSRYLPPPSENQRLRDFVKYRPSAAYSKLACDVWTVVAGRANLRIHAMAGAEPIGFFEKVNFCLLDRISEQDDEHTNMKLMSLLFVDKFEEAAQLQHMTEAVEPNFLRQSLLSAYLLLTENPIDERARILLKASAMRLFNVEKWDDGILLMRIGRLDKEAAEYLINNDKTHLAAKFVRSTLTEAERKAALLKLGAKCLEAGKTTQALVAFAVGQHYPVVLFTLFTMGLIPDAHFLLLHLQNTGRLSPCTEEQMKVVMGLMDIEDLERIIEEQFQAMQAGDL
jgi:WD40 repeat protein